MAVKIDTRNAGCAVIFNYKLYVWGGHSSETRYPPAFDGTDSSETESSEDSEPVVVEFNLPRKDDPDHPFDVLDLSTRQWNKQPTSGDVPSNGNGSSLNVYPPTNSLYLIGGWNDGDFDSDVYMISVDVWKWEKLQPATSVKPSPRYTTGVLIHRNHMCMFGGLGLKIVPGQDPGADYNTFFFKGVERNFGWNNEYYEFNLTSST